jgi:copper resistance protein B
MSAATASSWRHSTQRFDSALAGAFVHILVVAGLIACVASVTNAQSISTATQVTSVTAPANEEPPVMDNNILGHVLFNQFEGRTNGPDNEFRWDGEGWIGTDMNKLWFKSEGFLQRGKATDGISEALYDRPIPHLRYFDLQAGVRYDLDSSPGRTWGAIGIEGLAPYFFEFEPTFYFSDRGRFAGRITGSYDLLITNRLIAQPEFETNFYSEKDPSRGIGSGLSELDTGLRIRYEFNRKFAPYIGFAYTQTFGETATFTREEGGIVRDPRFIFGVRVWY